MSGPAHLPRVVVVQACAPAARLPLGARQALFRHRQPGPVAVRPGRAGILVPRQGSVGAVIPLVALVRDIHLARAGAELSRGAGNAVQQITDVRLRVVCPRWARDGSDGRLNGRAVRAVGARRARLALRVITQTQLVVISPSVARELRDGARPLGTVVAHGADGRPG